VYGSTLVVINPAKTSQRCSDCQALDAARSRPIALHLHEQLGDSRCGRRRSEEQSHTRN
jgi:transposase